MLEWSIIAFLGACVGSFLNVVIYRVPKGLSVVSPRSHCTTCNKNLSWYYNIPLLSWIVLRGKSGCCNKKISIQYPFVEFMSMFIFLLVFYKNGFNYQSIIISIVFALFLTLSVMDYYYHAIFDSVSLTTLAISIFSNNILVSFIDAIMVAGALTLLRFYVSFFLKKEAMGEGDIILGAAMGAILGVKLAIFSIFVAAVIALPFAYFQKGKDKIVPFVPFLSIGVLLVYIYEKEALNYLVLIGL